MNSSLRFSEALHSIRSPSKLNSEIISLNHENDPALNVLDKSSSARKSMNDFFQMSIEATSETNLLGKFGRSISPVQTDKPNFLSRFSQRFDVLRKNVQTEEDFLNASLFGINPNRNDGFNFGHAEITPLQELKFNSSFQNFNIEKDCSPVSDIYRLPAQKLKCDSLTFQDNHKTLQPIAKVNFDDTIFCEEPGNPFEEKKLDPIFPTKTLLQEKSNLFVNPSLQKLYDLFVQIFSCGYVNPEQYNLTPFEEEILGCLLQRKFYQNLTPYELGLPMIEKIDRINEIIRGRSNKRPEECYKFVLTRANKYLKRQLVGFSDPETTEKVFYEHYFGELSKQMELPIEQFIYPITRKQIEVAKLNSAYFERIFKSEQFITHVQHYLDNLVYVEYREELRKKLKSFLSKYDVMFSRHKADIKAAERHLKDYLLKNKRCKLPWTLNEIKESISRFQSLVETLKSKQC